MWGARGVGAGQKRDYSRDANTVQNTPRRSSPTFRQVVHARVFFLAPRLQMRYFDSKFIPKLMKS